MIYSKGSMNDSRVASISMALLLLWSFFFLWWSSQKNESSALGLIGNKESSAKRLLLGSSNIPPTVIEDCPFDETGRSNAAIGSWIAHTTFGNDGPQFTLILPFDTTATDLKNVHFDFFDAQDQECAHVACSVPVADPVEVAPEGCASVFNISSCLNHWGFVRIDVPFSSCVFKEVTNATSDHPDLIYRTSLILTVYFHVTSLFASPPVPQQYDQLAVEIEVVVPKRTSSTLTLDNIYGTPIIDAIPMSNVDLTQESHDLEIVTEIQYPYIIGEAVLWDVQENTTLYPVEIEDLENCTFAGHVSSCHQVLRPLELPLAECGKDTSYIVQVVVVCPTQGILQCNYDINAEFQVTVPAYGCWGLEAQENNQQIPLQLNMSVVTISETWATLHLIANEDGEVWIHCSKLVEADVTDIFLTQFSKGLVLSLRALEPTSVSCQGLEPSTLHWVYARLDHANSSLPCSWPQAFTTAPPPPVLVLARFGDSGATITTYFSTATDQGFHHAGSDWSVGFACNQMFFQLLDEQCSWISSTQLLISLTTISTIVPGEPLKLRPGVLKVPCSLFPASLCDGFSVNGNSSAVVLGPSEALIPLPSLLYSPVVGICDGINIDATGSLGSGGRALSFSWTLVDPQAVSFLSNLVEEQSGSEVLTIPSALLPANISLYHFNLTLCNFLGQCASAGAEVTVTAMVLPSVVILGIDPQIIHRSETLTLIAQGAMSTCSSNHTAATRSFGYSWEVVGYPDIISTSIDPKRFTVPPFTFEVGETYNVICEVEDSWGTTNTATSTIHVEHSTLYVVVNNGGEETVEVNEENTVVAYVFDPDAEGGVPTQPILYHWICMVDLFQCPFLLTSDDDGESLGDTIVLEEGTLEGGRTYIFSVNITDGLRSAYAEVSVLALLEPVPDVVIETVFYEKVNANEKLTIEGIVSSEWGRIFSSSWTDLSESNFRGQLSFEDVVLTPIIQEIEVNEDEVGGNGDGGDERKLSPIHPPSRTKGVPHKFSRSLENSLSVKQVGFKVQGNELAQYLGPSQNRKLADDFEEEVAIIHNLVLSCNVLLVATYKFELSALYTDTYCGGAGCSLASITSISTIEVIVNAGPVGGSFTSFPQEGEALITAFDLLALNWADEDLPLSYSFYYWQPPLLNEVKVILRDAQMLNRLDNTILPQGESYNDTLLVGCNVYDNLGARSLKETVVSVRSPALNISDLAEIAMDQMEKALILLDYDQVYGSVISVASLMTSTDCSELSASYCASLNRKDCGEDTEDNTCGACVPGAAEYAGGASCFFISSEACLNGELDAASETDVDCGGECKPCGAGKACVEHADCFSESCIDGVCQVLNKVCPGNCNAAGACSFQDINGNPVQVCDLQNSFCEAVCLCGEGFYGQDCSLTDGEVEDLQELQEIMLESLVTISSETDMTFEGVNQLATAAGTTVGGSEGLLSESSIKLSIDILNQIAVGLSTAEGNIDESSSQAVVNFISTIVDTVGLNEDAEADATFQTLATLKEAVVSNIVIGEAPTVIQSDALSMVIGVYEPADISLELPPTSTSMPTSHIQVSSSNAGGVSTSQGVPISATEWIVNPYQNLADDQLASSVMTLSMNNETLAVAIIDVAFPMINPPTQSEPLYSNVTVECVKNGLQEYQCLNTTLFIDCVAGSVQNFQCSMIPQSPQCAVWGSSGWDPSLCNTTSAPSGQILCSCSHFSNTGRKLRSLDSQDSSSVDMIGGTSSSLHQADMGVVFVAIGEGYAETWMTLDDSFNARTMEENMSIVFIVGVFVLVLPVLFVLKWIWLKACRVRVMTPSFKKKKDPNEDQATDSDEHLEKINEILPVFIQIQKLKYFHFYRALKEECEAIHLLQTKDESAYEMAAICARGVCVSVTMMVIQASIFKVSYPNNGPCASYRDQETCLAEMNPVFEDQHVCSWSVTDGYCTYIPPSGDFRTALFLGVICLVIFFPIEKFVRAFTARTIEKPVKCWQNAKKQKSTQMSSCQVLDVPEGSLCGEDSDTVVRDSKDGDVSQSGFSKWMISDESAGKDLNLDDFINPTSIQEDKLGISKEISPQKGVDPSMDQDSQSCYMSESSNVSVSSMASETENIIRRLKGGASCLDGPSNKVKPMFHCKSDATPCISQQSGQCPKTPPSKGYFSQSSPLNIVAGTMTSGHQGLSVADIAGDKDSNDYEPSVSPVLSKEMTDTCPRNAATKISELCQMVLSIKDCNEEPSRLTGGVNFLSHGKSNSSIGAQSSDMESELSESTSYQSSCGISSMAVPSDPSTMGMADNKKAENLREPAIRPDWSQFSVGFPTTHSTGSDEAEMKKASKSFREPSLLPYSPSPSPTKNQHAPKMSDVVGSKASPSKSKLLNLFDKKRAESPEPPLPALMAIAAPSFTSKKRRSNLFSIEEFPDNDSPALVKSFSKMPSAIPKPRKPVPSPKGKNAADYPLADLMRGTGVQQQEAASECSSLTQLARPSEMPSLMSVSSGDSSQGLLLCGVMPCPQPTSYPLLPAASRPSSPGLGSLDASSLSQPSIYADYVPFRKPGLTINEGQDCRSPEPLLVRRFDTSDIDEEPQEQYKQARPGLERRASSVTGALRRISRQDSTFGKAVASTMIAIGVESEIVRQHEDRKLVLEQEMLKCRNKFMAANIHLQAAIVECSSVATQKMLSRLVGDTEEADEGAHVLLHTLSWIFILAYIIGSSFYLILFGFEYGVDATNVWLSSFVISFFENYAVVIPFRVFMHYIGFPAMTKTKITLEKIQSLPDYSAARLLAIDPRFSDLLSSEIIQGKHPASAEIIDGLNTEEVSQPNRQSLESTLRHISYTRPFNGIGNDCGDPKPMQRRRSSLFGRKKEGRPTLVLTMIAVLVQLPMDVQDNIIEFILALFLFILLYLGNGYMAGFFELGGFSILLFSFVWIKSERSRRSFTDASKKVYLKMQNEIMDKQHIVAHL
mmetsp:Transcript_13963/g.18226  ORF Transcript_13963/g.18226 Transcript_13963/m.18226 type:complete len:2934 (-) Transcript_13963:266-9067(-)